jgi:hypothetical protein
MQVVPKCVELYVDAPYSHSATLCLGTRVFEYLPSADR